MQGFSVESKTSGISSPRTLTRPWSPVQVMQWSKHDSKKPRDQTREDDKLRGPSQKSAKSCETRSFVQLGEKLTTRATCRRGKDLEDLGIDAGQRRSRRAEVGPSRSAQADRPSPLRGPVTPFGLAAIRSIYSPKANSLASIHWSSTTEEQRREGHHLRDERVELVD
jgi:hypothetical protein